MTCCKSLEQLCPGESARVTALQSGGCLRRRLLDIGLIEGTNVECVGCSPCGDPKCFLIRGAVIAIRSADQRTILIDA